MNLRIVKKCNGLFKEADHIHVVQTRSKQEVSADFREVAWFVDVLEVVVAATSTIVVYSCFLSQARRSPLITWAPQPTVKKGPIFKRDTITSIKWLSALSFRWVNYVVKIHARTDQKQMRRVDLKPQSRHSRQSARPSLQSSQSAPPLHTVTSLDVNFRYPDRMT